MKKNAQNKNLLFSLLFILPDEELTKDKLIKLLTSKFKHLNDKKYLNLLLDAIMYYCFYNRIENDKPFSKAETLNFVRYLKEIKALTENDTFILFKYLHISGYINEVEAQKELLSCKIRNLNEDEATEFIQSIIDLKAQINNA